MNKTLVNLFLVSAILIFAVALALLSLYIERIGPEQVQYGNLCGANGGAPCYQPVLKGGFPIAYLFDAPGVSRERQLAFGEDNLSFGALLLDIAVYFALTLLAIKLARKVRG